MYQFVDREALIALKRRQEMASALRLGNAAIFLPLPPHIIEGIRGLIPDGLCFNTERKEPAHLQRIRKERLSLDNLSDVSTRLRSIANVVVDGQKAGSLLVVRSNVAAVLEMMLDRELKVIYFHRIPHVPKGQSFATLNLSGRDVRIATI